MLSSWMSPNWGRSELRHRNAADGITLETVPDHDHEGAVSDDQVRTLERFTIIRVMSQIFQRGSCRNHQQTTPAHAGDGLISIPDKETDPQNLPELSARRRQCCYSHRFSSLSLDSVIDMVASNHANLVTL